jgi:hypothetical protein
MIKTLLPGLALTFNLGRVSINLATDSTSQPLIFAQLSVTEGTEGKSRWIG